ncbi:MAG TPA: YetF domain-containing protein [Burkholderiaceae bacterium]
MNFDLETLFGSGPDLGVLQMTDRSVAAFLLTLAMLRIGGRRALGQHRAFDACATVLLGSVLSRAVVGASPFWPTMAAGATIVVLHRLVALASIHLPWVERLVSGDKRELVRDGARDRRQMRRALLSTRDLDEAVRKKTGDETTPLRRAVLERDGSITILPREGPRGERGS